MFGAQPTQTAHDFAIVRIELEDGVEVLDGLAEVLAGAVDGGDLVEGGDAVRFVPQRLLVRVHGIIVRELEEGNLACRVEATISVRSTSKTSPPTTGMRGEKEACRPRTQRAPHVRVELRQRLRVAVLRRHGDVAVHLRVRRRRAVVRVQAVRRRLLTHMRPHTGDGSDSSGSSGRCWAEGRPTEGCLGSVGRGRLRQGARQSQSGQQAAIT